MLLLHLEFSKDLYIKVINEHMATDIHFFKMSFTITISMLSRNVNIKIINTYYVNCKTQLTHARKVNKADNMMFFLKRLNDAMLSLL